MSEKGEPGARGESQSPAGAFSLTGQRVRSVRYRDGVTLIETHEGWEYELVGELRVLRCAPRDEEMVL